MNSSTGWMLQVGCILRIKICLYLIGLAFNFFSIGAALAADRQAPTAPTNLAATAASSTKVTLAWGASTDNVGVTGYRVERCRGTSCSNFSQIGTSTTTSYSDTGRSTSTTYRYRVRARDAANNLSSYSSIASATTPAADKQAPTVPTSLSATPASSSQINLSWTASTDNVAVTGYRVERCSGSSCTNYSQIATPTTTSYSDTGRSASTTYRYRVRATDATTNLSGYSSVANATTPAVDTKAPTTPGNLTAIPASSTQINLSWSASTDNVGVTQYLVERCTGASCTNYIQIGTPTATSYNDTGLTVSATYRYRMRAKDAANNLSVYSTVVNATTPDTTAPSVPTGLGASATSSTQINLSWTASTDDVGVTTYLLERCSGSGCSTFSQIASPTGTIYSDISLNPSNDYTYRVRASDAANNLSDYSTTANATTQAAADTTPPATPSNLSVTTVSTTQLSISWGASTDNVVVTGYQIERCQSAGCTTFSQITTATATSYNDTTLSPATTYGYRIRAMDAANNLSSYSAVGYGATQYEGPIIYTYGYDALGRLSTVSGSDDSSISYQYDANGNVNSITRQ